MMNSSSSKMRRRSSVSQQLSAARQYRLQALREDVIDIRLQMDTRRPHEPDAVFVPTFRYHGKRRAGDELVGSSFYETLGKTHKRGSLPNLKPSRALVEGASKGGIQSQGPGSEVGTSARASAASNFDSATSDAQQDKGERGEEGNEGEGEVGHDNILLEAKQDLTPEEFDLIRAKLVLATAKRKPADARYLSNPELRSFSKNMTKRQRKELNALVAEFVDRTSKAVREKFEKKRTELDSKGIFHPSANALRVETMLEMELQKRLKLDVVEEKLLLTLMQYEKDRNMLTLDARENMMTRFESLFEDTAFEKVTDLKKESASRGGEMGLRFSVAIGKKWKRDAHRKSSSQKQLMVLNSSMKSTSVLPGGATGMRRKFGNMKKRKMSRSAPVLNINPEGMRAAVSKINALPAIAAEGEGNDASKEGESVSEEKVQEEHIVLDTKKDAEGSVQQQEDLHDHHEEEHVPQTKREDKAGSLYTSTVGVISTLPGSDETAVAKPAALALTIGKRTTKNLRSATAEKLSSSASAAAGIHMEENNFNQERKHESEAFAQQHLEVTRLFEEKAGSKYEEENKSKEDDNEDDFPWEKDTCGRGKGDGATKQLIDSNKVEQSAELVHRGTHVENKNAEEARDWAEKRGGKSLRDDNNTGYDGGGADSIGLLVSGSPAPAPTLQSTEVAAPEELCSRDAKVPMPSPALQPSEFNGKHIDGFDEFMASPAGMKTRHDFETRGTKLPLSILRAPEITMRAIPSAHTIASQDDVAYPGNPYLDMSTIKPQRRKRRNSSFMISRRGTLFETVLADSHGDRQEHDLHPTSPNRVDHPVQGIRTDPEEHISASKHQKDLTKTCVEKSVPTKEGRGRAPSEQDLKTRLQRIWRKLEVPTSQKLDYITKYSSSHASLYFGEAIRDYEGVADAVAAREMVLEKMRWIAKKRELHEFVSSDAVFSAEEIRDLVRLGCFVKKEDMFGVTPTAWCSRMVELTSVVARERIVEYEEAYGDVVRFRGDAYLRHLNYKGKLPGKPVPFVGNSCLRKIGDLLLST